MVAQGRSARGRKAATNWQAKLRTAWNTLFERLLSPVDIASLVFFRVFFGILAFWHVWLLMRSVKDEYIRPDFHFTYYGLGWIDPLPGELMNVVFLLMAASAVFIALGLYYRAAAATFFILHTYAFLIDISNYWNHYYLISLLAFLMIFVPAHKAYSLDVARGAESHSDQAPAWSLWILRGQMGIVYFYAGLAKLTSPDWWDGEPMRGYLASQTNFPLLGRWFTEDWMVHAASYSGMLFDLLIVPLLLWPRTRIPALVLAAGFHLSNSLLFDIQLFPWLALAATLLFLPPSWPRLAGQWRRLALPETPRPREPGLGLPGRTVAAVLLLYFVVQIILPLRNYAYPGDSKWTREGYFFSWRMLLADAQGPIAFYLSSKTAEGTCEVNIDSYLYPFQRAWLLTPDLMVQFAHYLAAAYKERGAEVAVHVWTDISMNDRTPRLLVDPEVDLASVSRTLGHYRWLRDVDDASRLEKPVAQPCPDPLPLERVRQIEDSHRLN